MHFVFCFSYLYLYPFSVFIAKPFALRPLYKVARSGALSQRGAGCFAKGFAKGFATLRWCSGVSLLRGRIE